MEPQMLIHKRTGRRFKFTWLVDQGTPAPNESILPRVFAEFIDEFFSSPISAGFVTERIDFMGFLIEEQRTFKHSGLSNWSIGEEGKIIENKNLTE